jgi:hypothetical protein
VKIAIAIVLLASALAWAGTDPDPTDYTVNVHVSSSSKDDKGILILNVVIDEKKYALSGYVSGMLLALGDYKAKLVKDEHKTTYGSFQVYEFLFPDKKIRQFEVVGRRSERTRGDGFDPQLCRSRPQFIVTVDWESRPCIPHVRSRRLEFFPPRSEIPVGSAL